MNTNQRLKLIHAVRRMIADCQAELVTRLEAEAAADLQRRVAGLAAALGRTAAEVHAEVQRQLKAQGVDA